MKTSLAARTPLVAARLARASGAGPAGPMGPLTMRAFIGVCLCSLLVACGGGGESGGGTTAGGGGGASSGASFVEPLPNLSAWESQVGVDGSGVIHSLVYGSDSQLRYLRCASNCGLAASWTSTVINPGVAVERPVLRVTADGRVRVAIDNFVAGTYGDYIGFCDANCTTASNWSWIKLDLPASVNNRTQSHYLGVGGDAMILGIGVGLPMTARVCIGDCKSVANWTTIAFSSLNCSSPNVAVSPTGAMVFSCVTYDFNTTPTHLLEVWSCPANCDQQANWSGVTGMADGNDMYDDVTIAPDGRIGVLVNLGTQVDTSLSHRLAYLTCGANCGDTANWSGELIPGLTVYSPRIALDADATGRTAIVVSGSSGGAHGLFVGKCAANCTQSGNWTIAREDNAARLNTTLPQNPPGGCTNATWIADRVNGLSFRAGIIATTAGYGAIGTGGTCFNNLFSPTSAYTYIRSVASFGLLPY